MRNTKPAAKAGRLDAQQLEDLVLNLKGREWQKFGARKRVRIVEQCFHYWRSRGFPHYRLSDSEMAEEYRRLARVNRERILLGDEIQLSRVGVNLANYFHPQMWAVPVGDAHAPVERFNDDEKLRRLIHRAFNVWPDRYPVNESNMRQMLK